MQERIENLNRDGECQRLVEKLEEGALTPAGANQARSVRSDLEGVYPGVEPTAPLPRWCCGSRVQQDGPAKGVTSEVKLPCDVQLAGKVDELARSALSDAAVLLAHHASNESAVAHARVLIPGQFHRAKDIEATLHSRAGC